MKKLLVLLVVSLFLGSCIDRESDGSVILLKQRPKHEGAEGNPFIEVIDSCEYILWGNRMAHKGNCKFCKARRQTPPKDSVR